MKIVVAPQWNDKGTYKEPTDGDNARVPRLEVDNADTYLDKDGAGNMTFKDVVTGEVTLADLLAGGGGGGVLNLDGGFADSVYGGTSSIDGGDA
jgi:hypothetical protein